MQDGKQMSETFLLGSVLACVGGFLDAYTYLCRGKVFANAETGNIVLMGLKLADGDFLSAFKYLVPILAFASGVIVAEIIKKYISGNRLFHWRQIVLLIEMIVMVSVAFIPDGDFNILANSLVSFICSLQVQSFRKVNGNAYATTMCTGNLRSGTENLFVYLNTKSKSNLNNCLQYYGIIGFFIVGAVIGALLCSIFGIYSIFFSCVGLIFAFLLMFK